MGQQEAPGGSTRGEGVSGRKTNRNPQWQDSGKLLLKEHVTMKQRGSKRDALHVSNANTPRFAICLSLE